MGAWQFDSEIMETCVQMTDEKEINTPFEIEQFVITIENLDLFKVMPTRRLISETQVQRIHGRLMSGDNPLDVMTVNKNGGYVVIDGNHRLEAVRRFFLNKKNKDMRISVTLKVYHDLTEKEMLAVYDNIAKQRTQTFDDALQLHSNTIDLWTFIRERGFPCKVYISGNSDGLKFKTIVNALSNSYSSEAGTYTPKRTSKSDIVDTAQSFTMADYAHMVDFLSFFIDNYGMVTKQNLFVKPHFFEPLFDIFMKNKSHREDKNFSERFRKIIGNPFLMQFSNMGGRENRVKIRQIMLDAMNKSISKNHFI